MSLPDLRTENGKATTADDPLRLLWYGPCLYWTDDWSKPRLFGPGIPCCPKCGAPGFQSVAQKWFDGAEKFQADDHPRYVEFLNAIKEQCFKGQAFLEAYKKWVETH